MSNETPGRVPALDPALVAAISDLELVSRLIVEGARSGPHRSPFHGFSTEFRQHRPYRPGDDLRRLDWKLFGRTDRLYTRQFSETTNLSVILALDASGSMNFPAEGVSKFKYASMIAAALAHLLITSGDRVGLMSMSRNAFAYVPAKGGRPHLRTVLAQIERLRPSGAWDGPRVIARSADLLKRRGIIIVLSDFYDAEDETLRALKRAATRGHDLTMMQILSPPEVTMTFNGDIQFEDLELGTVRLVNAGATATTYVESVRAFLDRWRRRARTNGIDYARFGTDEPPDRSLRGYLLRRGSRPGAWRDAAREDP